MRISEMEDISPLQRRIPTVVPYPRHFVGLAYDSRSVEVDVCLQWDDIDDIGPS